MRTETIQVKKNKEFSQLCHLCKNLYNLGLYYINMNYEIMDKYLNWYDTKWMLKSVPLWKKLPAQVAQNVLKYLHLAWKSYFESLKVFKKNPAKWLEDHDNIPQPPHYLRKNGEFVACFNHQHINIKKNKLYFPKKTNLEPIEVVSTNKDLQQVRIVPKNDIYNLELVYNHLESCDLNLDKNRIIAIDIGVNNLACIVNNIGLQPFIINGKPLKSINHYYNQQVSKLQSIKDLQKREGDTKKIKKLRRIRNNKIKDYMHKASRRIINYCIENNIGTIIIGKNKNWKQNTNIGKVNNQNFVQIPFNQLLEKLQYKTEFIGIEFKTISEEYTSLCSFLDNESIEKHENYQGKRIKRGLFQSSDGRLINADVNGAYNIMKKAFPKAINADGIQGAQLHPLRINLNTKSNLIPIKPSQNRRKMV